MGINFRNEEWSGSLLDLLEECNQHLSKMLPTMVEAHYWLMAQTKIDNNILPIRKYSGHSKRGQTKDFGSQEILVMAVDNEPLCSMYSKWMLNQQQLFSSNIANHLKRGEIIASWKCDVTPKPAMKFCGVKTVFRDRGLKLAHIFNAGTDIGEDRANEQLKTRFMRSLSPFNIFLFPSHRSNPAVYVSGPLKPTEKDLAEDSVILKAVLGWMNDKLKENNFDEKLLEIFKPNFLQDKNWSTNLKETKVSVGQRGKVKQVTSDRRVSSSRAQGPVPAEHGTSNNACPRVTRLEAQNFEDSIEKLREWVANTTAYQIDGSTVRKSNPARWFHLCVEGYGEGDSFTSRHGDRFRGTDYNGIVNFHGDTPVEKVREFIKLIDESESYRDVLIPSATQQHRNPKPGTRIMPKFALQGYVDEVGGFFLYHDDWE